MRALSRAVLVPTLVGALIMSALLAAAPAQAQKIRPNFWGMHDPSWETPPTVPVGSANLTTSGTYWNSVETSRGVYDWSRLDRQVLAAEARGSKPMLVLGGTPTFHSTDRQDPDRTDPPRMKPWKRYVAKVARRYGARLDYQIWPEPNIVQNWSGSMRQLAKVTVAASRKVNNAAPRAKVVGPAMTLRLSGQRAKMVKFYRQSIGGKRVHRHLDVIAIDTFPELRGQPEDAFRLMQTAKKQLRKAGVRRTPYWNNEINYGVYGGFEDTPVKLRQARQKAYVIRTYALSAAAGMKRTYWLGWFHTTRMAVHMTDDTAGTQPAPPSKAYTLVRSWMNGTRFRGCDRKRSGVWVCTASKGKEVRRIYWTPKGKETVVLPRSRKRLENQNGAVDTSPKRRVRVTYRPVMVASRS